MLAASQHQPSFSMNAGMHYTFVIKDTSRKEMCYKTIPKYRSMFGKCSEVFSKVLGWHTSSQGTEAINIKNLMIPTPYHEENSD